MFHVIDRPVSEERPVHVTYDEIFVSPDIYLHEGVPDPTITLSTLTAFPGKVEYKDGYYVIRPEKLSEKDIFLKLDIVVKNIEAGRELVFIIGDKVYKPIRYGEVLGVLRGTLPEARPYTIYYKAPEVPVNILWGYKLNVYPEGSSVYVNGVFSHVWEYPFSVNFTGGVKTLDEFLDKATPEEKRVIVEAIKKDMRQHDNEFELPYFKVTDKLLPLIAEAIREKGFDPVILYCPGEPTPGDLLISYYYFTIPTSCDKLAKLIPNAYTTLSLLETLQTSASIPYDQYDEEVVKAVTIAKWMLNTSIRLTKYDRLLQTITDTPVYVVKEPKLRKVTNSIAFTKTGEGTKVVIVNPDYPTLTLSFLVFHEFIHVLEPDTPHGSYEFERYYDFLIQTLLTDRKAVTNLINITRLTFHDPRLTADVTTVKGLDTYVLSNDLVSVLTPGTQYPVKVIDGELYPADPETKELTVVLEKHDKKLELKTV